MNRRVVYFNGTIVPEAEARISIYDSGVSMGDMAFEVTRTYRQKPFRLDQHVARLYHTLEAIHVDPRIDQAEMLRATEETLVRNLPTESDDMDWNIIHNVSSGPAPAFLSAFEPDDCRPTVIVSCFPLLWKMAALAPAYDSGIDLVVPPQRAIPASLFDPTIKTRSRFHYHLAATQADRLLAGSWAVLVDPDGYLTEGTIGNVFLVLGSELHTPRAINILPGVTRSAVFELAEQNGIACHEVDLTIDDAARADEMFITSTSIGLLQARSFERRSIGDGHLGPVTARLRSAFEQAVGLDFAAQARDYAQRLAASQNG